MENKKHDKAGFTLVEVIVTMVIIAMLAAISIPTFYGFIEDAKKKSYLAEGRIVCEAIQVYLTQKYATGTFDIMDSLEEICMYPLDDENNALSDILKGSYTKGAYVEEISVSENTMKLNGIVYIVDGFRLEIYYKR